MLSIRIKKKVRNKQTPTTNLTPYICPKCQYIIVLENKFIQDTVISCPNCEQKNVFKIPLEKPEKKYEKSNKLKSGLSQINFNVMIIGFILTLTSIALLLFIQNPLTNKLSLTLLLIAAILQLNIIKKEQNISIKITFVTIIYIILLFLATGTDLEIFFILIFLGILITKALINEYLPDSLRIRMNLFLSIFFIIFVISITKRIISLVNI
ncbi:MAG: hypothetical protein MUO82_03340 [Candidatus Thermoplasmatota archaeon]|nr:hypothetical protein [Candidatus Thermoplasmatota archaeon]